MTDETRSETEIRADLAWVDREGPGSARMGCERLAADVPGLLAKLADARVAVAAGTDWMRKAEALRAERDALHRQLEAVRKLHQRGVYTAICAGCGDEWPCPTAAALGGVPEDQDS